MPSLGVPELLIILVVVIMVFGPGKLPEVGSALGKGLREFRRASVSGPDTPTSPAPPAELPPPPCRHCGQPLVPAAAFCIHCGAAVSAPGDTAAVSLADGPRGTVRPPV